MDAAMKKSTLAYKWDEEGYNKFIYDLKILADEKYLEFQSGLVPTVNNMLGIKIPVLRKIAKDISKGDWEDYFKVCRDDFCEETMIQGFVINNLKIDIKKLLLLIDNFVEKISDWATCDTFCSGLKIVKDNKEDFFSYIQKLLLSEKEFYIRTALVLLIAYYIDDEHIDNIFEISSSVRHEGYYAKMANAWLIASCFSKFKEKTVKFLLDNKLDDWTHNKAVQKIVELKTISFEEKEELKKLKR